MTTKLTEQQLLKQRDEILEEYVYHEVIKLLEYISIYDRCVSFRTVREAKASLKTAIDKFIEAYTNRGYDSLTSCVWHVHISYEIDNITPLLCVECKYTLVPDAMAYEYYEELKKNDETPINRD